MGRKFIDEEDSPQYILINDLKKSKALFVSLSTLINNDLLKKDISESINNLESLITFIEEADNSEIIDLLEKYENRA